jgi:sugar phosphate isomerase/epimerase
MSEWFEAIGERVVELHIHDNNGRRDEHLPIGDGRIDFKEFFGLVARHSNDPIFTIEPHGEEALQRGLKALEPYLG